jgi:hypothetical protein
MMVMNSDCLRFWKKAVRVYFKTISLRSTGETNANHNEPSGFLDFIHRPDDG